MQAYQERVIQEKAELDYKIEKLDAFFASKVYLELSHAEKECLISQFVHMNDYSHDLGVRIAAFVL